MLRRALFLVLAFALSAVAQTKPAQSKPAAANQAARAATASPAAALPANDPLLAKVEAYLRVLFAWGPDYQIKLGPAKTAQIPGLDEVPVQVNHEGHSETGTVYVTKDGRYMFRGEIRDLAVDPFAENRAKLQVSDAPSIGPAAAKVTVVEFSDFECPHCREMYSILKVVEPEFPQVRFAYKNFPLTEIHPWAMTAAIAARCAFQSSPDAFWKVHNQLFDNQDTITADNAWDEVTDFATSAGLSADALHTCMAAPEATAKVEADLAEGKALGVESTPTFFINGRPMVGGDKQTLEQAIRFELARSH
ncbi:MAG TPA: thioredoxin domain-containing protein [Candidatus Acidoferrales bacterium]|nr:thioredoxin domain-containing protein [Candidatus Acidoferrales bacterium]